MKYKVATCASDDGKGCWGVVSSEGETPILALARAMPDYDVIETIGKRSKRTPNAIVFDVRDDEVKNKFEYRIKRKGQI